MKVNDINFRRESLLLPVNGNDETWDYLTLYNEKNEVIVRSKHYHPEGTIHINYEGFNIIAPPLAKTEGENSIYITIASIKEQIKKS